LITSAPIAKALLNAHKRGVKVKVACEERDNHQGGVIGDGKGGGSGDEEKRKEMLKYKREKMLL